MLLLPCNQKDLEMTVYGSNFDFGLHHVRLQFGSPESKCEHPKRLRYKSPNPIVWHVVIVGDHYGTISALVVVIEVGAAADRLVSYSFPHCHPNTFARTVLPALNHPVLAVYMVPCLSSSRNAAVALQIAIVGPIPHH